MKYIGNINTVINDDLINVCIEHAKVYKNRNRTWEEKLEQTINGEAIEKIVCSYYKLDEVPFEIPEYDGISKDGKKFEIKHTIKNDKYWTYKQEKYEFFLKNAKNIDYIVLCYLDKPTGNVYLKFLADAKTFFTYSAKSKFNDDYYYKMDIAENNNKCKKY